MANRGDLHDDYGFGLPKQLAFPASSVAAQGHGLAAVTLSMQELKKPEKADPNLHLAMRASSAPVGLDDRWSDTATSPTPTQLSSSATSFCAGPRGDAARGDVHTPSTRDHSYQLSVVTRWHISSPAASPPERHLLLCEGIKS